MRMYIKLEDIMKLRFCSNATASRYCSLLKTLTGKTLDQKLTVLDYCRIEQVGLEELKMFIDLSAPAYKKAA